MAEKNERTKHEQNTSQHLKKTDNAQQQNHPNSAAENSTTNNSSEFAYDPEDDRKIYIGWLREEITEKDLSEHFGKFGEINYIDFKVDTATGRSRGFAFIVFKTKEGMDNALACNNHLINDMKIEPKKAIPQRIKLFVGGLCSRMSDDDIKNYFKRYTPHVIVEMKFDRVNNIRKGFCFVMIDDPKAVTEILRLPRHVIRHKQVDINIADVKLRNKRFIPGALGSMNLSQGNVMGQGGFLPQAGYALHAPGYRYGGYGYYPPYTGYYPNYHYSYGYPSYVARAEAGTWSEGNEASGVNGNHIVE
ncbi:RNA-binding protein squid-like [Acyrthosiphon pisum]|uniref:RRM domain-containing protein n=1 Tax=Acyrthosiphon pisum TaxID=7029 RepID=A0A8R2NJJ0_ACYPI|nr:RNA-binding protein squid-like [Acyrthosiphon pisum]